MKHPSNELYKAYERVKKVLFSCETMEQLKVARKMAQLFDKRFYGNDIYDMSSNLFWIEEIQKRKIHATTEESE